ncbi:MAG: hypothetical protein NTX76_03645 [Alphaproteobacteria bacterium]|nr:hypothetical protein [Alphaproteobacteria bacterium]
MISVLKLERREMDEEILRIVYMELLGSIFRFKQETGDLCNNNYNNQDFDCKRLTIDIVAQLKKQWIHNKFLGTANLKDNLENLMDTNQLIISEMARSIHHALNSLFGCAMTIDHGEWEEVLKRIIELERLGNEKIFQTR